MSNEKKQKNVKSAGGAPPTPSQRLEEQKRKNRFTKITMDEWEELDMLYFEWELVMLTEGVKVVPLNVNELTKENCEDMIMALELEMEKLGC